MFRSLKIYIEDLFFGAMKILKEKSRSYKGQNYYKFKVNIPEVLLMECHFKEGDELEAIPEKDKLILKKKTNP